MSDYEKYYSAKLYPLQNGVLNLVRKSGTPFFLTGGTALSRFYYSHRYSDDLDFFLANDPEYSKHLQTVLSLLTKPNTDLDIMLELGDIHMGESFSRVVLNDPSQENVKLQLDFINDVANHYGEFWHHPTAGKIDSWQNILSNKIAALFRSEPKDVVDIWVIASNKSFQWKQIIREAKSKEAGIEPEIIYEILRSFPVSALNDIKWIQVPDKTRIMTDIERIADDIFYGRENSCHSPESRLVE